MKNVGLPLEVHCKELDIMVRPYLTYGDIIDIAETALRNDNVMEQEICIALNTIDRCCKDVNIEEVDIDDIMWGGLWEAVEPLVTNVDMVRKYIERKDNASVAIANFMNNTLPKFMDKIDKKADRYIKHMPNQNEWSKIVEEMPKGLKDVLDIVKQDGNAEIIRGAMKMGEK